MGRAADSHYHGNLPTGKRGVPQPELLEQLYQKFNCAQPMDYHGHSLSVSDVILLNQAGKISAHYVDSIGFRERPNFLKPENYLKNAEMLLEDDYGMIDGIINNHHSYFQEEPL